MKSTLQPQWGINGEIYSKLPMNWLAGVLPSTDIKVFEVKPPQQVVTVGGST